MKNKTKIFIVVSCIFLIYCIYLFIKLISNPIDTFIVEQGKIYKEEIQEGYLIREEQIIENTESGEKIVQLKTEGQKVANGEEIYRYTLQDETEINKKIDDLDNKIQEALKKENAIFSTDIKSLENQIEDKFEKIYENTNVHEIEHYKKEISNSIVKKAKIAGNMTSAEYIKQLIGQRSELEKNLNSNSKYVYSNKSGIISYKVDELENTLVTGDFSYLNKNFLDSLHLKSGQIIASSNSKAKIINNFNCYIAFVSKSDEAINSEVGKKIKIRLPSSEEIPAKIAYKSDQSNDGVVIVLEINEMVEKLIDYRKITFDVIWWSDLGIKVPNSAIKYEGNLAYVIRNRAGYEEKIFVKILRQNENYAIVENYSTIELQEAGYDVSSLDSKKSISLYDELIIKK